MFWANGIEGHGKHIVTRVHTHTHRLPTCELVTVICDVNITGSVDPSIQNSKYMDLR